MSPAPPALHAAQLEQLVRVFVLASDCAADRWPFPWESKSAKELQGLVNKRAALAHELEDAFDLINMATEPEGPAGELSEAAADPAAAADLLRGALSKLDPPPADVLIPVLLDASLSAQWPKGVRWTSGHNLDRILVEAAGALSPRSGLDVAAILNLHKSAVKRLRKDSMSPAMQAGVGVAMAAGLALSGGAANAIGTMVGTHVLGLSGAAATSAGLAALGGGSIAAGGAGMAGGAIVAGLMASVAKGAGTKVLLGVLLAKESPGLFVHQLAKADVACQLGLLSRPELVADLAALQGTLKEQLHAIPEREGRPERVRKHARDAAEVAWVAVRPGFKEKIAGARDLVAGARRVWDERADKEERNLAASIRAVEFELRHLESPTWKRRAAAVPRVAGLPALSKLLDRFE